MHDLNIKLLRAFLSVASERSFSKAAECLACSQATMSQRIRQLEEQLGISLFERNHHDVVLTLYGAELLPHAQKVVDEHDGLLNLVRKNQIAGRVRLGIAEDYVMPMLPKLLKRVQQVCPAIELSVVTDLSRNLWQQVEAHSMDLSVVTLPELQPEAHVLAEPHLQWVQGPSFRPPNEEPWPLALFPDGCAFRSVATASLHRAGLAFDERLVSASGQLIQAAVAAGMAITAMARTTIPAELSLVPESYGLPSLPRTCIQIIQRERGLSDAAQQIKELVIDTLSV